MIDTVAHCEFFCLFYKYFIFVEFSGNLLNEMPWFSLSRKRSLDQSQQKLLKPATCTVYNHIQNENEMSTSKRQRERKKLMPFTFLSKRCF